MAQKSSSTGCFQVRVALTAGAQRGPAISREGLIG
jgi:hypothetical protein